MKQVANDPIGVSTAIESFKNGGVIIFPTDTVYGIGCNPYDEKAIKRIYELKNRHNTNPLPVLGYSKQILENIVEFDSIADTIAEKFWPGRLTIILPLKDNRLKILSNGGDSLAVRVPNNKCILSLLKECELIVGTSANISGKEPFTDPQKLANEIIDCDVFVNGGKIHSAGASTIIEIVNQQIKILRSGDISENDLVRIL